MLASFLSLPVSLILMAGTTFCLIQVFRSSSWVSRTNYLIHALMSLGMLGMVWHTVQLPLLPQLLLFGAASFWFLLQAVSRQEFSLACRDRSERIHCLYHAAMLAAMVFMLAAPHPVVAQQPTTVPVQHDGHAAHTGHSVAVSPSAPLEAVTLWIQPTAQILAVLFAAAVLAWLVPLDRVQATLRHTKKASISRASLHRHTVLERTYEAGAALAMSLMFTAAGLPN